jgi:hypothetical protein
LSRSGNIRHTNKTAENTPLKFDRAMTAPGLLHGCENWVKNRKDKTRTGRAEIRSLGEMLVTSYVVK